MSGAAMSTPLRAAVARFMRPLVRAMIRAGVTFPAFVDLAREIYVDIAMDDGAVDGHPPSFSRISIVSGVHRKEVRRLATRDRAKGGPPPALALGAKAIAVWTGDPRYTDEEGQPLPLPRSSLDDQPSFDQLVTSISKDIRPRALLDEWLAHGIVRYQDDLVHLTKAAFVPAEGYEEKAYYFGRNLRDHVAAGAHNLLGGVPPLFDRAVYYDRLAPETLEELRRTVEQRAQALLLEINRKASELALRDRAMDQPTGRFTFGAYFYAEDEKDKPCDPGT